MTSAFSWQNSVSLCPASICTPRPYDEDDNFLLLFLDGLAGLHGDVQLHLLSISTWDIDLSCCDIEWFALETKRDHSAVFESAPKHCISDSFVDREG